PCGLSAGPHAARKSDSFVKSRAPAGSVERREIGGCPVPPLGAPEDPPPGGGLPPHAAIPAEGVADCSAPPRPNLRRPRRVCERTRSDVFGSQASIGLGPPRGVARHGASLLASSQKRQTLFMLETPTRWRQPQSPQGRSLPPRCRCERPWHRSSRSSSLKG